MRMAGEWFEAARRYTDSPSLGRCVHDVQGTMIKKALRRQVHRPQFTPKDSEFEVLTKLMVLEQQPAQAQEPRTHEITFFGPILSTFGSHSGHHCAGIPKSKGERPNPIKRAGKEATAKKIPGKGSRHRHPWFNTMRVKRRSEHHIVRSKRSLSRRPRSQSSRPDTRMRMKASSLN
jgi:hypothetical protein